MGGSDLKSHPERDTPIVKADNKNLSFQRTDTTSQHNHVTVILSLGFKREDMISWRANCSVFPSRGEPVGLLKRHSPRSGTLWLLEGRLLMSAQREASGEYGREGLISYGATDPVLSNKRLYPNFYQTLQNDQAQFDAIVKLLRYFGWNWVGIIASDDDSGETQRRELEKMAAIHGICIEFSLQLPPNKYYKRIEVPYSRCSKDCLSGYRRVLQRGKHTCCFDCVPCSEGEISNKIDKDSCQKCADDQWPNEKKDKCVKKPTEFLSYDRDPVALVLCIISVTSSVITCIILGIFILYQDTPIVKANNRNLSFVLLVSLMLSFLCVFLFLGRPVDITCKLRQTAFGVIFSVAVSSLLAKTLMVCIAFKATKPGSKWRKYIGVKIPNFVVFICSFIQVVICICWLSISPPYQEMNIHSYPGKIIIQCNEGSVVAFYTVLGYMGFLAAVSFIVAFLARKLPDSFNEAKYITFSMLIFCNVWISFIPAYMSVMGKNTVIVEIFAILTSSFGILGCLFFPKCCIILLRPDMNSKKHLLRLEC
ncbi:vomeronasal type-2 receptor 26-like [Spea bombifrons]|uniref:vomeronasal type-2 receptor 26-like n=1 Tax=Spea bombifrons TaxID=233779 RepID=UPI00234B0D4C|nr:vomeronasal type-2 receptor 26-like [Spea bombifrons]